MTGDGDGDGSAPQPQSHSIVDKAGLDHLDIAMLQVHKSTQFEVAPISAWNEFSVKSGSNEPHSLGMRCTGCGYQDSDPHQRTPQSVPCVSPSNHTPQHTASGGHGVIPRVDPRVRGKDNCCHLE